MFETKIALKYLLPNRKSLSTSLIALMSLLVISMVVWLTLVFLSVTTGIEKTWLEKLTAVHAPIRIYPTALYYEKQKTEQEFAFSSPTLAETLADNPLQKTPPNLAKRLYQTLEKQKKQTGFAYQDYEYAFSLMRLHLQEKNRASQLSQMSYLLSFPGCNPRLSDLLQEPTTRDLQHWLAKLHKKEDYKRFFAHTQIKSAVSKKSTCFSAQQLPEGSFFCNVTWDKNSIRNVQITKEEKKAKARLTVTKTGSFLVEDNKSFSLKNSTAIFLPEQTLTDCSIVKQEECNFENLENILLVGTTSIQGKKTRLALPLCQLTPTVLKATTSFTQKPSIEPLWPYCIKGTWFLPQALHQCVILPNSYRKSGALLADTGYFSFIAQVFSSTQEMQMPFQVVGFYDPGIIPVGNRCIYTTKEVTQTLLDSAQHLPVMQETQNGIFLWPVLGEVETTKASVLQALEKNNLTPYFKIQTFREYPFAKDLMAQFQSDRMLFLLIAMIMIFVACSNIISMLIVLVKDKKQEIAILCALGASKTSIAMIFGGIGMVLGALGSFLGSLLAIVTLKNLSLLVQFLSWLQGHDAFQEAFFGKSLPNVLSYEALVFVLITTPIASLCAGLIPAYKASRIHPTKTLRS